MYLYEYVPFPGGDEILHVFEFVLAVTVYGLLLRKKVNPDPKLLGINGSPDTRVTVDPDTVQVPDPVV
jgi:hypothetical protein